MEINTFKDLSDYLKSKKIIFSVLTYGLKAKEFYIQIDMGIRKNQYRCTWGKNTRGVGYYFYDCWIYTEKEMVQIILKDL